MLNIPRSTSLTRPQSQRSPRHPGVPEWETKLRVGIGDGLVARQIFDWSSARQGNLIFTSEFDLPGELLVSFESCPSQQHWGAVDVSIVVCPRATLGSSKRPGDILPLLSPLGRRQGEATAIATMHDGDCSPPYPAFLYVSRWLQRRWPHVCEL